MKFGLVENHGIKGCFEASWLDTTNPYLKLDFQFESGKIELSAFPWHIRWTDTSGRWKQKYYLRNRISMKFLNFQAPGLEASLWRELASIRNSILGIPQISVNHASFADGLEVAKSVESLRREILMNERQDTLAFPSLSSQLRQFQEKQSV
ncbi:MAG: hypothetical protein RJA81_1860 [Planctomycetota bacterium]